MCILFSHGKSFLLYISKNTCDGEEHGGQALTAAAVADPSRNSDSVLCS